MIDGVAGRERRALTPPHGMAMGKFHGGTTTTTPFGAHLDDRRGNERKSRARFTA